VNTERKLSPSMTISFHCIQNMIYAHAKTTLYSMITLRDIEVDFHRIYTGKSLRFREAENRYFK
jgi:hypothetical protein